MEQFIPEEVFGELRGWAEEKAPCRVADQPKFGRERHRIEVGYVDGKLIAMSVLSSNEEVLDILKLS